MKRLGQGTAPTAPHRGVIATPGVKVTEFLTLLLVERPEKQRRIGAAGLAAKKYGVGRPSRCGMFVQYGLPDYVAAARVLGVEALDREPVDRETAPPAIETVEVLPAPGSWPSQRAVLAEERSRTDMRRNLIAARLIGIGESAEGPVHFVTLNWQQAVQMSLDAIILCQRLETLLHLQQFAWLASYLRGRRAMAVYVGDSNSIYREKPVNSLLAARELPVLCLFDWTPRSLVRATSIKRFEAFCWPPRLAECEVQTIPASFEALARFYKPKLKELQGDVLIATWEEFLKTRKVWSTLDFVHCT